jgi:hypothetical protein
LNNGRNNESSKDASYAVGTAHGRYLDCLKKKMVNSLNQFPIDQIALKKRERMQGPCIAVDSALLRLFG